MNRLLDPRDEGAELSEVDISALVLVELNQQIFRVSLIVFHLLTPQMPLMFARTGPFNPVELWSTPAKIKGWGCLGPTGFVYEKNSRALLNYL